VLRRATALAAHPLNRAPAVYLHADDAKAAGLAHGDAVRVGSSDPLPVVISGAVPAGAAWIEAGHDETAMLPPYGAALTLSKA
jgi:NADH-quinone oxidoreductase subunit G